jgi:hypothetical protein
MIIVIVANAPVVNVAVELYDADSWNVYETPAVSTLAAITSGKLVERVLEVLVKLVSTSSDVRVILVDDQTKYVVFVAEIVLVRATLDAAEYLAAEENNDTVGSCWLRIVMTTLVVDDAVPFATRTARINMVYESVKELVISKFAAKLIAELVKFGNCGQDTPKFG